jgi:cobalt-zinc-cadmium efflux system membrane fusion protein
MLAQGVGTQREVIEADLRVTQATTEVARASTIVRFIGRGGRDEVVVRAPVSGTVLSRRATPGLAVNQGGEPLVELGDPSAIWMEADVFERDLPMDSLGAGAAVELPVATGQLRGRVVSIGSVIRDSLRTAPVRIAIAGYAAGTAPGHARARGDRGGGPRPVVAGDRRAHPQRP